MWDVFAVSTYFTVSVLFWYMGLIPDLAVMRDRAKTKIRKFGYGLVRLGLDRFQPALEQLREGLSDSGRPFHAAGALGAFHRVAGLLRFATARLAYHHLPALFRGGRGLFRLRHGADAAGAVAPVAQAGGHHHGAPCGIDVQSDFGDRLDCGLRLRAWSFSSPGTAAILTSSSCSSTTARRTRSSSAR